MIVHLGEYERYSFYTLIVGKGRPDCFDINIEVTTEFHNRYIEVMKAFEELQREIRELA